MNIYTATTIINTAIIIMVGITTLYTGNAWCLLGLLFMMSTNTQNEKEGD